MYITWTICTLETAYFPLLVMQELITQILVWASILTRYCLNITSSIIVVNNRNGLTLILIKSLT